MLGASLMGGEDDDDSDDDDDEESEREGSEEVCPRPGNDDPFDEIQDDEHGAYHCDYGVSYGSGGCGGYGDGEVDFAADDVFLDAQEGGAWNGSPHNYGHNWGDERFSDSDGSPTSGPRSGVHDWCQSWD